MAIVTTPLGFQKPDGYEMVRDGENVIATNAGLDEVLHADARARIAQVEAAAGFPGTGIDLADAAVNPLLDTATATRAKLDARYKGLLPVNVKDYGAKGDGTTDDSAAIQAALNAAPARGVVIFPAGTYKIVTGLTSATPDVRLRSDGGRLLAATAEMTVLTVTGARTRISLHIDGADLAANGLSISAGGCEVRDGTYENIKSVVAGSNAIRVLTADGVAIERNLIRNVFALSDSVPGNSVGASRAVLIAANTAATSDNIVSHNRIYNVTGEEGDAVQLIFGVSPFLSGRGVVSDNIIDTVSRRAVKIQAADCEVSRNTYRHSSGIAPTYPAALLDVVHSSRVTVSNNTLDAAYFMGIQASGPAGNPIADVTISGNTVRAANANVGIYLEEVTSSRVSGNEVTGGSQGMSLLAVTDTAITENIFRGSVATGNSVRALSTCARLTISRNIAYGGGRAWFIQNDSPGAVVENNHARFSSGTGGCIRTTDTATGSLYRGNTAQPNGSGIYNTNYTNQTVTGARGNSATGGGDVMWTTAIPSTEQPATAHARGQIAYALTPSAGGTVGWVCTSNGTPGIWKTFGTISA